MSNIYEPIQEKVLAWIWYEDNKPKTKYEQDKITHDSFRQQHDLDCVLSNGNLNADTIFSLWLPLRFTLVSINGYKKLNEFGNLNSRYFFLKVLLRRNVMETLLPKEDKSVKLLSRLFQLGQTKANVMLLPSRLLHVLGMELYYDYMPYFLFECFAGGNFHEVFGTDEELVAWIKYEKLESFFVGEICTRNIKDLAGTNNVKYGVPKNIDLLLKNYIDILEARQCAILKEI